MPMFRIRPPLLVHALRTALAATATLGLTRLVGLEYGYWAVISAIIVMQSNVGGSVKAALQRVQGTCLGAAMGILFLLFGEPTLLTVGIAVFLTLALAAVTTGALATFRMAGVTAGIVLLAWGGRGSPVWFGLERVTEILIGVSVAVGVSMFLWPSRAASRLREELAAELEGIASWVELCTDIFLGSESGDGEARGNALLERLQSARDLREQSLQESYLPRGGSRGLLSLVASVERIFGLARGLWRTAESSFPPGYQALMEKEVRGLASECAYAMRYLGRALLAGASADLGRPPRLPVAVEALEDRMGELRREKASERFELMQVAEAFAFAQNLKNLAVELEWFAISAQDHVRR
ncbi:MAG: aromatic acid exporter family protein [Desulfovibrionaceae bacterium]